MGTQGSDSLGRPPEAVLEALRCIGKRQGLTPVLELRLLDVAEGLSNKEIACRYEISINTVKTEVAQLLSLLQLHSRHEIHGATVAAARHFAAGASGSQLEAFLSLRLL